MKAWEATVAVCRETKNPCFMFGDEGLAHLIAERLGWEHDGWRTTRRLLRALSKPPGQLKKELVCGLG